MKTCMLVLFSLFVAFAAMAQTGANDDWPTASTIEVWYSRLPQGVVPSSSDVVWNKTFDDGKIRKYEYCDCSVGMNVDYGLVLSTVTNGTKHVVIISKLGRNDVRIPDGPRTDFVGEKCGKAFRALPPLVQQRFLGNYGLGTPAP